MGTPPIPRTPLYIQGASSPSGEPVGVSPFPTPCRNHPLSHLPSRGTRGGPCRKHPPIYPSRKLQTTIKLLKQRKQGEARGKYKMVLQLGCGSSNSTAFKPEPCSGDTNDALTKLVKPYYLYEIFLIHLVYLFSSLSLSVSPSLSLALSLSRSLSLSLSSPLPTYFTLLRGRPKLHL